MNILGETYIFYVDVYFIQNLMIKIAVLYLSFFANKQRGVISSRNGIVKIILAAFLGTVLEIIGLIYGGSYNMFILLVHLFEVPLMFRCVLGKEKRFSFRLILTGYFYMMLINGALEVLWNQFGERGSYLFYLMFSCGAVIIGVRIWYNYTRMQKGVFQVELLLQGKQIQTYGFYDSGNQLRDTYTGKGVHIVSEKLFRSLGLEKETPVLLPYQALGNESGIIEVYYVDELIIEGGKQKIQLQKCPLGVTKDNLFEEKKYEMILNEEVF